MKEDKKNQKRKKPSNLFLQHREKKIPRDFRAEGGRAPPLDYSRPTEDQYLPQLNKTGAAVRENLLAGTEFRSRTGFKQFEKSQPPSRTASITPQIREKVENELMFMEDERRGVHRGLLYL